MKSHLPGRTGSRVIPEGVVDPEARVPGKGRVGAVPGRALVWERDAVG